MNFIQTHWHLFLHLFTHIFCTVYYKVQHSVNSKDSQSTVFFNREDEICAHNIYISFYIWYRLYSLLKCVHKSFKNGSHVLQTLGQNIHTSSLLLPMPLTFTSTINHKYCYYYCFEARLSFMSIKHKKNKNMIQLYLFSNTDPFFMQYSVIFQPSTWYFHLRYHWFQSTALTLKIRKLLRVEKHNTASALCTSLYNYLNLLKESLHPLGKVIFYGKGAT